MNKNIQENIIRDLLKKFGIETSKKYKLEVLTYYLSYMYSRDPNKRTGLVY